MTGALIQRQELVKSTYLLIGFTESNNSGLSIPTSETVSAIITISQLGGNVDLTGMNATSEHLQADYVEGPRIGSYLGELARRRFEEPTLVLHTSREEVDQKDEKYISRLMDAVNVLNANLERERGFSDNSYL